MDFPLRFKNLLEKTKNDIELFDGAWLTWAVCACSEQACSWEGWIIEDVFKLKGDTKKHLSCNSNQICPNCGLILFRTEVSIKVHRDSNQAPDIIEGVDYDSIPIKYK